ncbi:MAG: ABC transporter permease [Acidimicrobiaceae bacterium]|nr:ABC transporter permease [Acidimicrobiaceae bacterium]
MLRLTIKTLLQHKIRFLLTAGAVMVGVAFVVTSFVTADSLRSIFGDLAANVNKGRDFTVRGVLPFGDITDAVIPPVSEELLGSIIEVEGVAAAEGTFFVDGVVPVDGSDEAVTTQGRGPNAGVGWTVDEDLSQFYLIDGERPQGISEFAIGIDTFEEYDFEFGQVYQVVTPTGPRSLTLTGTMQFGYPDNAGVGAVFSVFDTATASEIFGYPNRFSQINIRAEPESDLDDVQNRIQLLLSDDIEIVTAEEAEEEFSGVFEAFIEIFQTVLLVFAFIVLFVSAFIISNTFNIVLGQRVRELSLLRAIGATPQQIRRSVLAEAFVTGMVAVVIGTALGMLGAVGLRGLFSVLGTSLPQGPLPLHFRTVIWASVLGIGSTLAAAVIPAVKTSRMSPVAGLHDHMGSTTVTPQRRRKQLLFGGMLAAAGFILAVRGLFVDFANVTAQLISLGVGAALVFVAVAVLSSLIVSSVVSTLVRPLAQLLGIAGRLARLNASRNPQRTAATAISLTVGLALVTLVSIVGQSLKDSYAEQVRSAVYADFVVTTTLQSGLPTTLADDLRAADYGTVVGFGSDYVLIEPTSMSASTSMPTSSEVDTTTAGTTETSGTSPPNAEVSSSVDVATSLTTTEVASLSEVVELGLTAGSLEDFDTSTAILVHENAASDMGLTLGDNVKISFVNGESRVLAVAAIYSNDSFWGEWIIDQSLQAQLNPSTFHTRVAVKIPSDTEIADTRSGFENVLTAYPQAVLEDQEELLASTNSQVNTVLVLVNVFLGFSLLIALLGIVNTLTLSVFERTSEIGLLRAVGMTRHQLRRMIRWEAASVALYGAFIGIVLGIPFGIVTALALPDDIVGQLSIPGVQLIVFLGLSVAFGLMAALVPSYRASRMDILNAITSQ